MAAEFCPFFTFLYRIWCLSLLYVCNSAQIPVMKQCHGNRKNLFFSVYRILCGGKIMTSSPLLDDVTGPSLL